MNREETTHSNGSRPAPSSQGGRTAAPQSRTAGPQSRTAGPQSRTAAPQSRTAAPQSRTAGPQSRTAGPQSRTAAPQSRTAGPQSRTAGPQRRIAGPQYRTSFTDDTEQERPSSPRRKSGFATRAFQQLMQCKSPSSCSTTSLAQLREKLTSLSPLGFTKVPVRIAAIPDLPAVKEQEEYDRLSSSSDLRLATGRRCGVALKKQYHSDSEALTLKKTIYLTPVVEEHSASLGLVAALGSTDQTVIYEAFEQLYRKNPKVDLADLLVEEAIEHAQDKGSGIISGKVTQDSDIVEDTPVEEPRRKKFGLKRRSRHIEDNKNSTDDSDVVDGTPCYDYDWRNRLRTKCDKANTNDESATLNDEAVSAYFGQLLNIDSEHSDEDNVIVDGIEVVVAKENNTVTVQADVIDCVNSLLDKVCIDVDKYFELLADQEQELDILGIYGDNNNYRSINTANIPKMNQQTPNSAEHTLNEPYTDVTKSVTLKFKDKKKSLKINTTRQKEGKRKINQYNTQEDSVLKENTYTKSPNKNTEPNKMKELIIKKRKLYSPKDDDNKNQDITKSRIERRPSTSKESPIAACYKDLENARRSRIRLPRKRTSSQPVISPKTKKLNEMFDKIKDNVVNDEKITLVDKKSEKDFYNMSSESDDGAFKKKKIQVQKRISSTSLESTSKHGRPVKPVDYTSYYSSEDECQRAIKPKRGKQTKVRNRKVKKNTRTDLIDERMRVQQPEVLETSFVQEKGDTNTYEEPEPALQAPVLEAITSHDIVNEPVVPVNNPRTLNRSEIIKIKTEKSFKKRIEKLAKPNIPNKSKAIVNNLVTERESATGSPLPGLVVEKEPHKDDMTSLDGNLLQKLKKIYIDVDELNTTRDTQNLLLNNNNYENEIGVLSESGDQQHLSINLGNYNDNAIIMSDASEKSIATCGCSPITGHNNSDERPPNLDTLYESFQHRDVDVEGMAKSIAEFVIKMRNQTTKSKVALSSTSPVIPITRISTKDSEQSNSYRRIILQEPLRKSVETSSIASDKSNPLVLLERLSSKDIEPLQNPATPKSKAYASSVEFGKIITPTRTQNSTTTGSPVPVVVLDRVSSDEISRWLPMPGSKVVEEPKLTRRISARRRSVAKSCVSCVNTKPKISPVKLNFDLVDLTGKRVIRSRTRSIKSIKSRTSIENLSTKRVNSAKEKTNIDQGVSSQGTAIPSSEETANMLKQGKTVGSTVDPSEMNKSVASVESWIKRNAAAKSSKTDDNARKDLPRILYEEVMETLRTRLLEINEKTGEALQAAFLKDQEELTRLKEEFESRIVGLQKSKMEQACALIRADAENKARMVLLLKEDMTRLFK